MGYKKRKQARKDLEKEHPHLLTKGAIHCCKGQSLTVAGMTRFPKLLWMYDSLRKNEETGVKMDQAGRAKMAGANEVADDDDEVAAGQKEEYRNLSSLMFAAQASCGQTGKRKRASVESVATIVTNTDDQYNGGASVAGDTHGTTHHEEDGDDDEEEGSIRSSATKETAV
ncbi:MAG: hypothetical protein SGARI_002723 [Bacillariaceae sp.]